MNLLFTIISIAAIAVSAQPPRSFRTNPPTSDFDTNGVVNVEDYRLFAEAFGSTNRTFDLNMDGVVDFADLFLFADRIDVEIDHEPSIVSSVDSESTTRPRETAVLPSRIVTLRNAEPVSIDLPHYQVVVSRRNPFGITSLRLKGQPVDFAHKELPLADWEWFWFDHPNRNGRAERKLLQTDWGAPQVIRHSDHLVLVYKIRHTLLRGLHLSVRFVFDASGSRFKVEYSIHNSSGVRLRNAYVMVGFPGFSNHERVTEVFDALSSRRPQFPYTSFLEEAEDINLEEYPLLRHDLPSTRTRVLGAKGGLAIEMHENRFELETFYFADSALSRVYSAHTNKLRYLTSHLYLTLGDISDNMTRSITVYYDLSQYQTTVLPDDR